MYKDKFGNIIIEDGQCTLNPNNEDQVIFTDSGNVYEFINGLMDTDKPYMKKVGKNDRFSDTNFDCLPVPMEATILKDNDKLRWEI